MSIGRGDDDRGNQSGHELTCGVVRRCGGKLRALQDAVRRGVGKVAEFEERSGRMLQLPRPPHTGTVQGLLDATDSLARERASPCFIST